MDNCFLFQKSNDGRTAVYKQLLGDHRKITDKYKSVEKDLLFAKSEYLSRITEISWCRDRIPLLKFFLLVQASLRNRWPTC